MPTEFGASGTLRRGLRLLVTTRPVAFLSARYLPSIDRVAFRWTRGRVTPSAVITGLPIIQMTTIGARSGRPRTVRLLGVPDGDGFLVIAANFGGESHPAWYFNVRAHPRVTITTGDEQRDYDVRELAGDERSDGYDRALLLNPGWTRFRDRAGSRAIPVFRMTPCTL